jgi:putative DNA primase/helicase
MTFQKFIEYFPKSKFVKLPPFNEEELFDENLRKENKKPVDGRGIKHPLTVGEAVNHVSDGGRVGWIVPNDFIVIDIDNKDHPKSSFYVESILYQKGLKFWSCQSKQGTHFILRNTEEVMTNRGTFSGMLTPIGIQADGRGSGKGYIILPVNDEEVRQWKDWSADKGQISELPFWLRPLRQRRSDDPIFIEMPDGNGSDAMVKMRGIACTTNMITRDESAEALAIINEFIWERPMSPQMFDATVARDMEYDNIVQADGKGPKKENEWRIMAQKLIREHNLIALGDTIYKYVNGHYRPFASHELTTFILENGSIDATEAQRKETMKFIIGLGQKDPEEVNSDYATISVKNGMLDLNALTLMPHTPSNYNTIYIDKSFKMDIEYSALIDDFMKQISAGSERRMKFFYEVAGYCLLKKSIFEKFFIFLGTGGTGKSTYANLIMKMVGRHHMSNIKLNQFDQDYYLAMIANSLVNIDMDAGEKKTLEDSGRFKSVTCSEPTPVRQIYCEPVNMVSCATVIINSNQMPKIADKSDGLYRRMVIVEIDQKIQNPDIKFMNKVTDLDVEYFFFKACEAIHFALKRGHFTINESEESLRTRFALGQSNLKKWLQRNQMSIADLEHKPTSTLFQEYKTFCLEANTPSAARHNFEEEIQAETDMFLDFDLGSREWYLECYENDPRPKTHIFIKTEECKKFNPKWGGVIASE